MSLRAARVALPPCPRLQLVPFADPRDERRAGGQNVQYTGGMTRAALPNMEQCILSLCLGLAILAPVEGQSRLDTVSVPHLIFICNWEPHPPHESTLVVDLVLESGETNRLPTQADLDAVRSRGGRILHVFNVAMVRAAIDTAAVRALVAGPDAIATAAYSVPDTQNTYVPLQIFYTRLIEDGDVRKLRQLGAYGLGRGRAILGVFLPDSTIPIVERLPDVRIVRASAIVCAHPSNLRSNQRPEPTRGVIREMTTSIATPRGSGAVR